MNYFDLFNFKMAPVIDKTHVAKKYFELQKQYHPDFYTQATEAEKEEALEISSQINKAFRIFKDEDQTLEYFLLQTGTITADEKFKLPPDFLMEMMEINEAIGDQENEEVKNQINDFIEELNKPVASILDKESTAPTTEDLEKLKIYYFKKKYLHRILDRLKG